MYCISGRFTIEFVSRITSSSLIICMCAMCMGGKEWMWRNRKEDGRKMKMNKPNWNNHIAVSEMKRNDETLNLSLALWIQKLVFRYFIDARTHTYGFVKRIRYDINILFQCVCAKTKVSMDRNISIGCEYMNFSPLPPPSHHIFHARHLHGH